MWLSEEYTCLLDSVRVSSEDDPGAQEIRCSILGRDYVAAQRSVCIRHIERYAILSPLRKTVAVEGELWAFISSREHTGIHI